MHDTMREEPHEPVPQGQRELYSALMSGFGHDERDELERLMTDNEERLRETGDGYAP
jgi:hypothetical protein